MSERQEIRGVVMGGSLHVIVFGGRPGLVDAAARRLGELEQRWTRFELTSELTRLNRNAGSPTFVSSETAFLVERMCEAWARTSGLFDPSVHDSMLAIGYDRDLALVRTTPNTIRGPGDGWTSSAPGCGGIEVDVPSGFVHLPTGVHLDPGGIGKGVAADLVAQALLDAGAEGALVNLGGDLRAVGEAPPGGWCVGVEAPRRPGDLALTLLIAHGAVATSGMVKRRWLCDGQVVHHLIDPATGQPIRSDFDTVTVVTDEAWWAEALTKALIGLPEQRWSEFVTTERVIGIRPNLTVEDTGWTAASDAAMSAA